MAARLSVCARLTLLHTTGAAIDAGHDEERAARQGSARDARQESASLRVRMQRCNTHLLVAARLSACARLATVNNLHTTGAAIDAGCDEEGAARQGSARDARQKRWVALANS